MKLSLFRVLLIIFLLVLGTGVLIAFILLNHVSTPLNSVEREAALENILGRKPNLHNTGQTGEIEYKGKYLTFMYPARAKLYTFSDKNIYKSPNLEVFSFDLQDPRLVFNLSVSENLANLASVLDISGVKFRQDKAQGYIQAELVVSGEKGIAFTRNGEAAEKTGFFLVNNRLYSIAVTGSNYTDVVGLFDNVVKALNFK